MKPVLSHVQETGGDRDVSDDELAYAPFVQKIHVFE